MTRGKPTNGLLQTRLQGSENKIRIAFHKAFPIHHLDALALRLGFVKKQGASKFHNLSDEPCQFAYSYSLVGCYKQGLGSMPSFQFLQQNLCHIPSIDKLPEGLATSPNH